MTIAPSAALVLPPTLRLTPEQFDLVCEANPEAALELAADGQLNRLTPTGGDTGARNTLLGTRLLERPSPFAPSAVDQHQR